MLTQQQVTQLRTSAGLSPTPPAPTQQGSNDIIAQRRTALGMDTATAPVATPDMNSPSFAADTQNGGVKGVIDNLGAMVGNVPRDVGGIIGTAVQSTAGQVKPIIDTASAIYKDRGVVQGTKDIAGGFTDTITNGLTTAGEFPGKLLVGAWDKQDLIDHLSPIQDATLKQRDTILQKLDDAKKTGKPTANLIMALKYTMQSLDSLNSQIGTKEDRANSAIDTATNVAKYPIEHPAQTAIIVSTLPKGVEESISNKLAPVTSKIETGVNALKTTASDLASATGNKISSTVGKVKEAISPTLTPEEQVGKIIQGKTTDIPAAQRTFSTLPSDVNPAKMTASELSDTIQTKIDSNMKQVDTHFTNDNTPHPMSDFTQTVGKGKSAIKTNYVQESINGLKEHYTAIKDSQGLSDIKALEEKANTTGLTSKELNALAREQGTEIQSYKANGDLASSQKAQAAENVRTGLKTTARETLAKTDPTAAAEVTRLDKETSDAIHTKDLLDTQAQREATGVQKKGKPNAIDRFAKNNPKTTKAIKYGATAVIGGEAIKHILP